MKFKYLYIIILILALIPFVSAAAPVANFNGNVTTGPVPLDVGFTDTSSNTPTGWAWFFGDETYNQTWTLQNSSSEWSGRFGLTSVTLPNGSILVMGGNDASLKNDVWKSTNNGVTWTLINASAGWIVREYLSSVVLPDKSILVLGGSGTTAYQNDVWSSTNDGLTWTRINSSAGWVPRFKFGSVVLPDGSIVIFGGSGSSGALIYNDTWRSTDGGVTWVQQNASSGWAARSGFGSAVLQNGDIILAGGYSTSAFNDIWKSSDKGITWSQVTASSGWSARQLFALNIMPDNSLVLQGGTTGTRLNDTWRSTDSGITWTQLKSSNAWTARNAFTSTLLSNGNLLLMGGYDNAYKNDTWIFNPVGSSSQNPTHVFITKYTLYTISLQSFNSDGYNNTVKTNYINTSMPPTIPIANFGSNVTSGSIPFAVSFTDSSTDSPTAWAWFFGDEIWTKAWARMTASGGWAARQLYGSVILPDGSIILMGGVRGTSGSLNDTWKSTDNGTTWTQMNASSGWQARYRINTVTLSDGSIILMGGYDATNRYNDVWRSRDDGITWTLINASAGWSTRSGFSTVVLSDDSIILMGGDAGTARMNDTWKSIDGGITWTRLTTSAGWTPRMYFTASTLFNDDIVIVNGVSAATAGTRYNDAWKSTDGGTTWSQINSSVFASGRYSATSVTMPDNSIIIMGGIDTATKNDAWRTTDSGITWTRINASAGWAARSGLSSVVIPNGSIVLMGGNGAAVYNDTWLFNPVGSSLQNPVHTYSANGTYNVSLQAITRYAFNNTYKLSYITTTSGDAPVADFTMSNTTGLSPLPVNFTDTSTNSPTSWNWTFGGGNFSNAQHPTYTFVGTGNYSVILNATNAYGSNTKTKYVNVTPPSAPVADFTMSNSSGLSPLIVNFTDTSTNSPTSWNWTFGGGNFSNAQNPTYTFVGAGNYSVILNATNAYGSNTKTKYVDVTIPLAALIANFTANTTSGLDPLPVLFTDNSTDTPIGWTWFFGDESYNQSWFQETASAGWSARWGHTSVIMPDRSIILMGGNDGTYKNDVWRSTDNGTTWTLMNTSAGWAARDYHSSVVLNNGHIILFGGLTAATDKNDVWRSTDNGTTWTQLTASAEWATREQFTSVVMPDNSIILMGGRNYGTPFYNDVWRSTDSGTTWTQINASAGWRARSGLSSIVTPDGTIMIMGGYGDNTVLLNDVWRSIDNGTTWTQINSSAGWTARHLHSSVIMPDKSVILLGGIGFSGIDVRYNDVWRSIDNGTTWTQINSSAGWTARNAFSSVVIPNGNIVIMRGSGGGVNYYNDVWKFNPSGSSLQNPTHTYTIPGIYTVSLRVYNPVEYNSTSKVNYMNVNYVTPVSNFTSNMTVYTVYPMVVQFNDTSTINPTTWNWSFGDGRWFNTTNSNLKNTTYQYAVAGKYTVNLTVNNTVGSNTISKFEYINLTSDNDNNLTVWAHMNGTNGSTTFVSEKGIAWTTNGGARISTLQPKYGGASGWFPSASNSYISTPNSSALQFGTGDFTIEFWVNVTTVTGTNEHIFSKTNNPRTRGWGLDRTNSTAGDSGWNFYMGNDSAGQVFFNAPIPNKTWTHIAVERISGTIYLYINGNLTVSKAGYNANYDTSDPLWIGRQQNSYFNGYVDEFRISKTARWKSNFTPPYNEYRGTLETIYPDINPESTFRYKTDPTGSAYIDNVTGTRNRTIQIQNITNTSYVVGSAYFQPLFGYAKSVQLNTTYYPSGMTLISSSIDNVNGIVEFNVSKPTGFTPGTDRASIVDYTFAYINYTDGTLIDDEYFAYGYLINESTQKVYGVHNFLGTPVTYGDWNFTANFTANNLTTSFGLPVQFVSTFNGSYPNRWNWSFGDGTFDNGTNSTTTHSYSTSGYHTVSLTEYLWQNSSITNTITKTNYIIAGDPPIADFIMSNQTGVGQLIINFTDTSLNSPTSWNWSFDGLAYSDAQNPTAVLTGEGNYTIILNATNLIGSNYSTQYANISYAPTTDFTMTNQTGTLPLVVNFIDTSGYGPIIAWNWTFGLPGPGNYSDAPNPTYIFTEWGNHSVKLYTANIFGTNVTTKYVNASSAPVADFTMSNSTSNPPMITNFTDTSLYVPTAWNWSFKNIDGNNTEIWFSQDQNPTYIFNELGNFTITLNASSSYGYNITSKSANVSNVIPPVANFFMNNTTGISPLAVNFTDSSINTPTSWNWSFGNGVYSDIQNPTYTFTGIGNYTITLNATNMFGSNATIKYVEVIGPPIANFTTSTQVGAEPLLVNFTDYSQNAPTDWNWSFNDRTGNNTEIWFSTLQNPNHSFFVGNYTIKLNASNIYGYDITPYDYWINVSILIAPIADFTSTSTGGPYPPVNVQFNDTSLNFPTQWNWSFGDGNVSALQNPLHNYTFCGNFSVLLRVENGMGVDWKNTTDYVGIECAPIPPTTDERIAQRMTDIEAFVVIAAIILVIAIVATFIYMWAKRRS